MLLVRLRLTVKRRGWNRKTRHGVATGDGPEGAVACRRGREPTGDGALNRGRPEGAEEYGEIVFDRKEHTNGIGCTRRRDRCAVHPCWEPLSGD